MNLSSTYECGRKLGQTGTKCVVFSFIGAQRACKNNKMHFCEGHEPEIGLRAILQNLIHHAVQ